MKTLHSNSRNAIATILVLVFLTATSAYGVSLGTYTFDGPGFTGDSKVPVTPGLTYTPFTRTNLVAQSAANVFDSHNWNTGSSIDLSEFVSFTVSVDPGYTLSLDKLTFNSKQTGTGPEFGAVKYSYDGFADSYLYDVNNTLNPLEVWDFADLYIPEGQSIEFRFYGWDAKKWNGRMQFDNVGIGGELTKSVPEPVTVLAISMSVCGVGFYLKKRLVQP